MALSATSDRYFMVQDADDWSSLDRAALLYEVLRENNADAAFSAVNEYITGKLLKRSTPGCTLAPPPQLTHIAYHFGLYRTQPLRAIGGYHGGFRVGYDTLIPALLSLTSRLAYVDVPLYYYDHQREGSLSSSPATGMTSEARRQVLAELGARYAQAYEGFRHYVAGRRSHDDLCQRISRRSQRKRIGR